MSATRLQGAAMAGGRVFLASIFVLSGLAKLGALQPTQAYMQSMNGAAFDRTYVAIQRQDHVQAVRLVETYSKIGTNQPLKELAAKAAPVLEEHLKLAEALRAPSAVAARR